MHWALFPLYEKVPVMDTDQRIFPLLSFTLVVFVAVLLFDEPLLAIWSNGALSTIVVSI